MPNTTAVGAWRKGIRPFLKKALILHLAFVTACSNTAQVHEQSKVVEQSLKPASTWNVDAVDDAIPELDEASAIDSADPANQYDLPELGGPVEQEEPPAKNTDALSEFAGGLPTADQQAIANPQRQGYKGEEEFQSMAMGMLNSAATQTAKEWFASHNATTEMAFSVGSKGGKTASFDLLYPIVDGEKDLVFTQVGFRRSNLRTEDYRNTVNLGVGYRRNIDNWLAGVNAFYDRDMTGKNERLGIGAEVFTDNVRFSGNTYLRLSEWKKSPDLDYYLERPANGYDLRVEGNFPSIPQVVAKAVFEQYFGDDVGLFSAQDRQKDPKALTLGLTYSPAPMISTGVDYRQGQDGLSETSVKLAINYQFGVPLSKQLSMAYSTNHNIANSRYGLVNRNNEIVLDYKKAQHALLMLPPEVSGTPTARVSFPVTLTGGQATNFTWTGTASSFAQPYNSSGTGAVVLPAFNPAGLNSYTLQLIGTDVYGEVVKSNVMQVIVTPFLIALERSKPEAKADGNDEVMFTASLKEPTGEPRANTAIVWSVTGSATVVAKDAMTNRDGKANLKLTSRFSSSVRVSAKEPQGAAASADADFLGDPTTAKILSLVATPVTILANGTSTSTLVATVVDKNGNPLGSNIPVDWETTNGTLASASTVTDEDSKATVLLTSPTQIGNATITAKAVAGSATTKVNFIADVANAKVIALVATPGVIAADGVSTSQLEATIADAHGNPVGAGVPVTWAATDGTVSTTTSVTDANNKALMTLKSSTKMGTSTVTAKASAGDATAPVVFAADNTTAKVVGLTATPKSIVANGVATSTLEAKVEDANGNPVTNAPVAWTTSTGTLSAPSSTTDATGKTSVTLKGTAAGTATVKAQAVAGAATTDVDLTADGATAKVIGLVATPTIILANGMATSSLVATVEDAHGNPVPNAPVAWSSTLGDLSTGSSTTDANGKTTVILKGSTVGTAAVKAQAAAGGATANVELIADGATAKVIDLTATPNSIIANGVATSSLVATVVDASGHPVPNAPVTWTTSLGTLSAGSSTTDANGKTSVTLKGTTAGSASVKAQAVAGAATANVELTADGSTAKVIDLTATPNSIVANGLATSSLVATVEDAHGNPVANAPVTWSTSLGTLSAGSSTTDVNGRTTVTLRGTVAGSATVKAQAAAGAATTNVTLTADSSTARVVGLIATPSSIAANGVATSSLVATVEDANGNLVPNATVTWSTSLGTLSAGSSSTDASGKTSVTLKGSTIGTATVEAQAVAGAATANVDFIADASTAKVVNLIATPTTIVANGVATSSLVATVVDASGHPVPNAPVTWSTSLGTLSAGSSSTDASGKTSVTLRGTVAGSATVRAQAVAGAATANVLLIADASTPKFSSLVATPNTIIANNVATSTLVATLTDANNNPLDAGVVVNWSTSWANLSAATSTTDSNGRATVLLKGPYTGVATVRAATGATALTTQVSLVPDPNTNRFISLTTNPLNVIANGVAYSTVVAKVADANGNVGAGIKVTWSTNGIGYFSAPESYTDATGTAQVLMRSTVAGVAYPQANFANGYIAGNVFFNPDPATARVVSLVASPTTVPANGTPSTLYATVRDAYGNIMSNQTVYWATSLNNLSAGSSMTNASGVAVVNLSGGTPGTATVYARTAVSANTTANVGFTSLTETRYNVSNRVHKNSSDQGVGFFEFYVEFIWDGAVQCTTSSYGPQPPMTCSAGGFTYTAGTMVEGYPNGEYDFDDYYQITRSQ
jgi:adhesin/invasin